MRIEKTEMEFIVFDSQDVITTSGPNFGQTMAAQIGAIAEYNKATGSTQAEDLFFNQIGNLAGIGYGITPGVTKADNWLLYYGAGNDNNGLQIADSGSYADKPTNTGYFYVDNQNVSLISKWLAAQSNQ